MLYSKYIKKDSQSLENGLNNELQVRVDNQTLERSTSGIRVKSQGINVTHLNLGLGPNQIDALDIPINDTLNIFNTDNVESAVTQIASKMILYRHTISGFNNVTPVSSNNQPTSDALDVPIKTIANHNNGLGSSTEVGVVVNTTRPYEIPLRWTNNQNPVDDGNGNEVYARLTYNTSLNQYIVNYYSILNGVETAYTGFKTTDKIDFAYVLFSQRLISLPWADTFVGDSWQDIAGISSNIKDDNIDVDGMTGLLAGASTQAQVNGILDRLGKTTAGDGASLVSIHDAANYYTGLNVESALVEISNIIGGTNSATRDFTENNVVADNDNLVTAINKLDLRFGDLASTNQNEGASLVGIHDAQNLFTATNVENALTELALNKRNSRSFYVTLTSPDITNGYVALPALTNGVVSNNVVTLNLSSLDIIEGPPALPNQFVIMRNDAGTVDYIVWKNNVTPPGCSTTSSGLNSTEFGDLLEAGETLRFIATI